MEQLLYKVIYVGFNIIKVFTLNKHYALNFLFVTFLRSCLKMIFIIQTEVFYSIILASKALYL
jgi:hypothetical protein